MLSRASVDHRLTGTDSSMKLSRRSVSEPFCRFGRGAAVTSTDGVGFDRLSTRCRKSPTGLRGRETANEEVNLPFILSPNPTPRNDFRSRLGLDGREESSSVVRVLEAHNRVRQVPHACLTRAASLGM